MACANSADPDQTAHCTALSRTVKQMHKKQLKKTKQQIDH